MTKRPITGLSSMATRGVLADLAAAYERCSGCQVAMRSIGGVDAARLVRASEPVDVVLLASNVMGELEAEGHLLRGSLAAFARSGMAVAVRSGVPRPDVHDEDAFRAAILAARRIGYSTGPSGDHLRRLLDQWGIAAEVADRLTRAPPGVSVGALLARGDADLGFQQLSELLGVPDVDVVGPLPPRIQSVTVFSAGIARAASNPEAARALIAGLTSPDADATKRRHGMEPA